MYYCKVREQRSKVIRSINTFTKSEIIYSYDTDIQAGYDFTKIRYTVKDGAKTKKGKICVHLPEVEIISCDIDKDSFKLYHEDDNIFSQFQWKNIMML